jgi:hypothetical protein
VRALQAEELRADHLAGLLETAAFWHVDLDKDGLEQAFRKTLEKLAQESQDHPGDLPSLRRFAAAARLVLGMPFTVNVYQVQNSYYDLLSNRWPGLKIAAEKGDQNARLWIDEFRELGVVLSVKVE